MLTFLFISPWAAPPLPRSIQFTGKKIPISCPLSLLPSDSATSGEKEFVERFVRSGLFESVLPAAVNPMHVQAGMIDPGRNYTVYGVTPYIFLVDTRRLGSLPVPRSWEELLEPMYRNEIVMCGDGDDMADAVVLNLYKEKGIEGLRRLAHNVKSIMHSSQMAKIAGSSDPDAAAVFIIPLFFAESTRRHDHVRVVWPEDGAAASPLYFLVKKKDKERLSELLSFFTTGFASIKSASWFVPIGQTDLTGFPEGAKLKWIGWDYIVKKRHQHTPGRIESLISGRPERASMRLITVAGPPSCGKTSLLSSPAPISSPEERPVRS